MKITIVTPSFNQAAYLEETIVSIHNQGYRDLEHIIIDGGSTDGSVDIIKKYAHHLAYWVSEPDKGQSEALNKGLRRATGDIITWINSDDILMPGALHCVANAFREYGPEVGLVYGSAILFEGNRELQTIYHTSSPCPEAYIGGMIFAQPASFFHRSALEKVGLINEALHYGMDFDLFARLSLVTRFQQVPHLLAKYRLHYTSKTVTAFERFIEDWKRVFVNVCKNLGWHQEIEVLKTIGGFEQALSFYAPYAFNQRSMLDARLALFHHLCFLQYNHSRPDIGKNEEEWLQKAISTCFPGEWLQGRDLSQHKSILTPIHQSLVLEASETTCMDA